MKSTKLRLLLFLFALFIVNCGIFSPPNRSADNQPTNIEIQITGTEPIDIGTETISQPNCTGTAEVENAIEKSRTIQYVIETQNGVSVDANGQVGFAGTGVELGATVASQLGLSYGTSETLTRSITVKAKPGTSMQHVIRQVEIWKTGQAKISVGERQTIIPFKFRSDFAIELVNSQNIYPNGCDSLPSLPTDTPDPTNMPISTNTSIPAATSAVFVPPADEVLFQDDFENGLGLWKKYTGSWVLTNGKLSKLTENPYSSLYEWIGIEQPAWKNYIVSLDIGELKSNSYPPIAIVVRQNVAEAKYMGAELNFWPWIYLSVISNDSSKSTPIAGQNKNFTFPTGTEVLVEIEAKDDNYTLRVNGQQLQSVSIAGFDSPEIRIGLHCADYPGCPTFDNIKVTYLP